MHIIYENVLKDNSYYEWKSEIYEILLNTTIEDATNFCKKLNNSLVDNYIPEDTLLGKLKEERLKKLGHRAEYDGVHILGRFYYVSVYYGSHLSFVGDEYKLLPEIDNV